MSTFLATTKIEQLSSYEQTISDRSAASLTRLFGSILLLTVFCQSPSASAAPRMCPPDGDPATWVVLDVYAECDPSNGRHGRRSGTSGNECMRMDYSTGEAQACYQRISQCGEQVVEENKQIVEHNRLVAKCRSISLKQDHSVKQGGARKHSDTGSTSNSDLSRRLSAAKKKTQEKQVERDRQLPAIQQQFVREEQETMGLRAIEIDAANQACSNEGSICENKCRSRTAVNSRNGVNANFLAKIENNCVAMCGGSEDICRASVVLDDNLWASGAQKFKDALARTKTLERDLARGLYPSQGNAGQQGGQQLGLLIQNLAAAYSAAQQRSLSSMPRMYYNYPPPPPAPVVLSPAPVAPPPSGGGGCAGEYSGQPGAACR